MISLRTVILDMQEELVALKKKALIYEIQVKKDRVTLEELNEARIGCKVDTAELHARMAKMDEEFQAMAAESAAMLGQCSRMRQGI